MTLPNRPPDLEAIRGRLISTRPADVDDLFTYVSALESFADVDSTKLLAIALLRHAQALDGIRAELPEALWGFATAVGEIPA